MGGLQAAEPADNLTRLTAPPADADDREPRVAQPASALPGGSKRLERTPADWHAMRLRSDGGLPEHSGADHRDSGRFRAWGTLAFFRGELTPLAGEQIGVVEDASPGGLYIAIHQPPPAGTVLRMRIYCQAGPPGISVVEVSARVLRCQLHEPRGAGLQILDFADGERGRQAWLALVRQTSPNVVLTALPLRPPPLLLAASRRTAATGPAAEQNRQQWKARSRR
jgi:PilZ domain